jgi:lysophospholipase L1-like esterase
LFVLKVALVALLTGVVSSPASAAIVPGSKDIGAVWFIGDSITQSNADGDPNGSPRKSLYDRLVAGGYTFSYTGHSNANVDGLPSTGSLSTTNLYHYHSGVSGAVIGGAAAGNPSGRTEVADNVSTWWGQGRLASVKPNVVLIMIGTNDVDIQLDLNAAPNRLKTLVDTIYAQPGVGSPTVFLASIPPNRTNTPTDPNNVAAFNAAVPGVVSQLRNAGKDVRFVDQVTSIESNYSSAMLADNLHPNATGNGYIADQWFHAITAVPEPGTVGLLASAAMLVGLRRRQQR